MPLSLKPDVKLILREGVEATDAALERLLPAAETIPASIHSAMRHSTFAGGKRLRPVLAMQAAAAVAGAIPDGIADLGAAIEMLHTYSLIHDDLPALDNDDLRRGKPTCHVVYGEAIAILAGDALQTTAYEVLAGLKCPPASAVEIIRLVAGGIFAGATPEQVKLLDTFGRKAGLAFQIVDDVLDVTESSEQLGKTAGKDLSSDKATWPAVFGIEQSRKDAERLIAEAFAAIESFGAKADGLKAVAQFLTERKS